MNPFLFLFLSALATAVDQPIADRLHACHRLANEAERLACFDTVVVQHLKPQAVSGVDHQAVSQSTTSEPGFGLPKALSKKPRQDDSHVVNIVRIEQGDGGKLLLYTHNGQLWRQTQAARFHLNPSQLPAKAVIRRNFVGGYRLELDQRNQHIPVKRLR